MSHLAMLTAVLSAESHFVQSSAAIRPPYYGVPDPAAIVEDARRLLLLASNAQRDAVEECNGTIPSAEADELRSAVMKRAEAIAARYLATVVIDGDARGPVLYLRFPSGRSNSFRSGLWAVSIS